MDHKKETKEREKEKTKIVIDGEEGVGKNSEERRDGTERSSKKGRIERGGGMVTESEMRDGLEHKVCEEKETIRREVGGEGRKWWRSKQEGSSGALQ